MSLATCPVSTKIPATGERRGERREERETEERGDQRRGEEWESWERRVERGRKWDPIIPAPTVEPTPIDIRSGIVNNLANLGSRESTRRGRKK